MKDRPGVTALLKAIERAVWTWLVFKTLFVSFVVFVVFSLFTGFSLGLPAVVFGLVGSVVFTAIAVLTTKLDLGGKDDSFFDGNGSDDGMFDLFD